ncbi:MAG: TonB-dependent receptor [Terracidiphilus sp.]|nr:TonB-dependent receptor [Terracidiphilus sp.]
MLLAELPSFAQVEKGVITGVVSDVSGAVLIKANVSLTNLATHLVTVTRTDNAGIFVSPPLTPGDYEVRIEAQGLAPAVKKGRLEVAQRLRVDAVLAVASASQTVEVDATTIQFDTETSTLSNLRTEQAVHDLPLNGRNFAELLGLGAGVVPGQAQLTSSIPYTQQRGPTSYGVNGLRMTENRLLLDGIGDNENHNGLGVIIFPPIDAVEEFREETSNPDARFGRFSGGVINLVYKSGTSQYHGEVFDFLRNSALDAKNYFDASKPGFRLNSFGATLGGPVWRKKNPQTFFFADYAGQRESQGLTYINTVPVWGPKGVGDFSLYSTVVRDPVTHAAFAGNVVSSSYLTTTASQVGQKVLALYTKYAVPNVAGATISNNFRYTPQRIDNGDAFDVRVDHTFSQHDNAFLRYSHSYDDILQPGPLPAPIVGGVVSGPAKQPAHQAVLSETHLFSPTLLNTARFGWSRLFINTKSFDQGLGLPTQLGIPGVINSSDVDNTDGLPLFSIVGFTSLGDPVNSPSQIGTNNYQVNENLSWYRGKHSFDFGAEIVRPQYNIFQTASEHGVLVFPNLYTGFSLGDLLLGAPYQGWRNYQQGTRGFRQFDLSFYVQDNYKVSSRFSLNIGLRYENFFGWPWTEVQDRMYQFDPSISTTQVFKVGTNGVTRSGAKGSSLNFAPRLGVSYGISPKTTLHSGYGIYYAAPDVANSSGLSANAPAADYWAFYNGTYGASAFNYLSNGFVHIPATGNAPALAPLNAVSPNARTPYSEQWHLSLQQQIGSENRITVAYVGNRGVHLVSLLDINQATPGASAATLQSRRPYPFFGQISQVQTNQVSNYNGLQVTAERRSRDLSVLASYTFSHALDLSSATSLGLGSATNYYNQQADYGNSDLNIPNRFVASLTYSLPFHAPTWRKPLVEGWQLNAIANYSDGLPFSVSAGSNTLNVSDSIVPRATLTGGYGSGSLPSGQRSVKQWFNTAAFTNPGAQQWGNSGRNILAGPGTKNIDFSVFKNIPFKQAHKLELRAEFFNLFNTPQFNNPNATVGATNFGTISSAGSPTTLQRVSREIQLAAKIVF